MFFVKMGIESYREPEPVDPKEKIEEGQERDAYLISFGKIGEYKNFIKRTGEVRTSENGEKYVYFKYDPGTIDHKVDRIGEGDIVGGVLSMIADPVSWGDAVGAPEFRVLFSDWERYVQGGEGSSVERRGEAEQNQDVIKETDEKEQVSREVTLLSHDLEFRRRVIRTEEEKYYGGRIPAIVEREAEQLEKMLHLGIREFLGLLEENSKPTDEACFRTARQVINYVLEQDKDSSSIESEEQKKRIIDMFRKLREDSFIDYEADRVLALLENNVPTFYNSQEGEELFLNEAKKAVKNGNSQ